MGSVVGLITMLAGQENSAITMTTIPVALSSTLYGIVLANFFFLLFAANMRERTLQELFLQKIILEGILAISEDLHPKMMECKLVSFLTPSERKGRFVSYEKIRQRLNPSEEVQENT